jgi:GMP synthase-like glutamine amidotransferase
MSKALILQQVAFQGPGRIVPIFRDFGIPTDVRHLYRGDEIPQDLDGIRVLVVLDGPMSVSDAAGDKFPFLAPQIELLKRMVTHDRTTLGIGLGAQLLAHAGGAKVYPNTKPGPSPQEPGSAAPEYGWAPVNFPFPGGTEPMVMGLMDGAPMFHWHTETFDLPKLPSGPPAPPPAPPAPTGNSLLSSTRTCKNQAFRFKNRLFGFQYHLELTEPDIDALLAGRREELIKAAGPDAEQKIRDEVPRVYSRYNRLSQRVLNNFVQFLKVM